jgi:membrane carboxypeptidase/penicillin-binding protein
VYRHAAPTPKWLADGDRVAFFQLRSILEGVLTRGTARSLSHLATYTGGKTGTTDEENDAWFIGFTKDVAVAVIIEREQGQGGTVAAPIAKQVLQALGQ